MRAPTAPEPSGATCPLCAAAALPALTVPERAYWRCPTCGLVFVDRADLPDRASEAAHYRTHDNRPDDPRYQAFLARLIDPLREALRPGMRVLDYGAGDGSPVRSMLGPHGVEVIEYDPVFRPDERALGRRYDVVVCAEVVEHFHWPGATFATLDRLIGPGGRIAVMTEPLVPAAQFAAWWYRRDPTHVAFYGCRTMRWLGARFGWSIEQPSRTVTVFRKSSSQLAPSGSCRDVPSAAPPWHGPGGGGQRRR